MRASVTATKRKYEKRIDARARLLSQDEELNLCRALWGCLNALRKNEGRTTFTSIRLNNMSLLFTCAQRRKMRHNFCLVCRVFQREKGWLRAAPSANLEISGNKRCESAPL